MWLISQKFGFALSGTNFGKFFISLCSEQSTEGTCLSLWFSEGVRVVNKQKKKMQRESA